MNIIRIIDRYDRILDEFDTEFEYEIGETNNIDTVKLMDEILKSVEDKG